eukprot:307526-Ditylum_brightwellii.AAC.1
MEMEMEKRKIQYEPVGRYVKDGVDEGDGNGDDDEMEMESCKQCMPDMAKLWDTMILLDMVKKWGMVNQLEDRTAVSYTHLRAHETLRHL